MNASRKLRILYTNAMYSPDIGGGAEIMLKAMAEGMKARGHEVQALVTHSGEKDTQDMIDGVTVNRLKLRNIYWPFDQRQPHFVKKMAWHLLDRVNHLMAPNIRKILTQFKPDVIVSNNLPGLSIATWIEAKKLNIPVIQILHDYYLICPRSTMFKNGASCQKQCKSCHHLRTPHQQASNDIDAVVGVSNAILKTHLDNGLFSQTPIKSVIYNARPLPPAQRSTREKQKTVFGYIGALTDVKGVRELIAAFKLLPEAAGDFSLLVAGTGKADFTEELHQIAQSDARIHFLGHMRPAEFFNRIDACIVPSVWNDPLPGVTYEALNYGVPVIGSINGGIPEIIGSPSNGILFDPSKPGSLIEAMQKFAASKDHFAPQVDEKFINSDMMLSQYEALFMSTAHANQ